MNKFLEMLKKNWIGGVIGFVGATFFSINHNGDILLVIRSFFLDWGPAEGLGGLLYIAKGIMIVGYIVGAFIQSKVKR